MKLIFIKNILIKIMSKKPLITIESLIKKDKEKMDELNNKEKENKDIIITRLNNSLDALNYSKKICWQVTYYAILIFIGIISLTEFVKGSFADCIKPLLNILIGIMLLFYFIIYLLAFRQISTNRKYSHYYRNKLEKYVT